MRPWFRQKRWAFYALLGFAGVFVLVLLGLVALGAYRDWLIKTYTTTAPQELPDSPPVEFAALKAKWDAFAKELLAGRQPPPLPLSVDELNAFVKHVPGLSNKLRLKMDADVLKGDFSFPIGKPDQPKLRGRYLNGEATFQFVFEEGLPTVTISSVEANGRPLPRWLVKKLQRKNLVEDLDRDFQARQVLGRLEKVEMKEGQLWFVPQTR